MACELELDLGSVCSPNPCFLGYVKPQSCLHPPRFLVYLLKFMQSPPNLPATQIISNQIIRLSPRVRFHLSHEV